MKSRFGETELEIPRDRKGEYEPQIIKKYETTMNGLQEQIISLYAKGMSTRDIEHHMKDIYGLEVSPTMVSKVTDKIIPLITEWQSRPLNQVYPIVFLDAIHFKEAEQAFEAFKEAWEKKHPIIIRSWETNWVELTAYFKYPPEIRKMIYTTNIVAGYHRQLRKVTKTKTAYPSDDALRKIIYLATTEITKKWTMPVRSWTDCISQLTIHFGDRLQTELLL